MFFRVIHRSLPWLLIALLSIHSYGQDESSDNNKSNSNNQEQTDTDQSENATPATTEQPKADDELKQTTESFIPTEKISADSAVAFPVDI